MDDKIKFKGKGRTVLLIKFLIKIWILDLSQKPQNDFIFLVK